MEKQCSPSYGNDLLKDVYFILVFPPTIVPTFVSAPLEKPVCQKELVIPCLKIRERIYCRLGNNRLEMISGISQKAEAKHLALGILRRMLEEAKNNRQNTVGYDAYEYFYHREKALEDLIEEAIIWEG